MPAKWRAAMPLKMARARWASSPSVTQPFCGACARARISSDGQLYTCLFAQAGTDLRGPLRAGADDEEMSRIIRGTWMARTDRYSEQRLVLRQRAAGHKIEMNYIGG